MVKLFNLNNMKKIIFKIFHYSHIILFFIFFLVGLLIYKDYGFNIDETFNRKSGFYWLNFLAEFFRFEDFSLLTNEKLNKIIDFTMPWGEYAKVYSIIFDVPAAFLELVININNPNKFYMLRHLLTFLLFFLGIIYFYKLILNRFCSRYLALIGSAFLALTPRLFGDAFHNSKDIIFLTFFILSIYYFFKNLDNPNLKNTILFALFSSISTSLRLFGIIFPISFLFIYFLSILSQKDEYKKINIILIYLFFYIFFLIMHWPYLWSNPAKNFILYIANLNKFGPELVYYYGEFYNSKLVPFSYLPIWIFISTPFTNILLFLSGFLYCTKIYINKLFLIEKSNSDYDFWKNHNEKKDFIILIIFLVLFIFGTLFSPKHYNSWRIFYFLNFFIVYFSVFFINFIFKNRRSKKKIIVFNFILIIFFLFNIYRIIIYHPYQSIYFNSLISREFKNKFEADFFGLSGIEFLREIIKTDNSPEIKIGVNSWYPLWRMLELIEDQDKKRIVFIYDDINKADYVYSNGIYDVNINKSNKYTLNNNFKIYRTLIIDDVKIYEVYKRIKP